MPLFRIVSHLTTRQSHSYIIDAKDEREAILQWEYMSKQWEYMSNKTSFSDEFDEYEVTIDMPVPYNTEKAA